MSWLVAGREPQPLAELRENAVNGIPADWANTFCCFDWEPKRVTVRFIRFVFASLRF